MVITLRHLAKLFTAAALFSVVIVMSTTFFPFIGGKYYFFRVMTELGLVFLLLWWAFEAKDGEFGERLRNVSRRPLFIAVSAFVLAYMLATVFAYDPYGAFWSNYERGEGGFQMLHYYLFFVLVSVLFNQPKDWKMLFSAGVVAALCMIGYGVISAAGAPGFVGPYLDRTPNIANIFKNIFEPNGRFQGSLGNPAYVAPYLLFAMFYAAWLWMIASKSRRVHAIYGVLVAVFFLFFILSQTRGAFIGLITSAFIFLAVFAWMDSKRRMYILGGAALLILAIGIVGHLFAGKTELERQITGGRLLNMSFSAVSAQTRLWTWKSAWLGFLDRPFFGWGPENFSVAFDKHFDVRHFAPASSGGETWFDRAHSIVFDYLAATGIFGFATFFGMFVVFFWELVRHIRRRLAVHVGTAIRALTPLEAGLLAALPVAYLVQGLILFDVLPIYMNVFLFLAFASDLFEPKTS